MPACDIFIELRHYLIAAIASVLMTEAQTAFAQVRVREPGMYNQILQLPGLTIGYRPDFLHWEPAKTVIELTEGLRQAF